MKTAMPGLLTCIPHVSSYCIFYLFRVSEKRSYMINMYDVNDGHLYSIGEALTKLDPVEEILS